MPALGRSIAELEQSATRLRRRVDALERAGDHEAARQARAALAPVLDRLSAMRREPVSDGRARPKFVGRGDELDEGSLDAVMRDCPL